MKFIENVSNISIPELNNRIAHTQYDGMAIDVFYSDGRLYCDSGDFFLEGKLLNFSELDSSIENISKILLIRIKKLLGCECSIRRTAAIDAIFSEINLLLEKIPRRAIFKFEDINIGYYLKRTFADEKDKEMRIVASIRDVKLYRDMAEFAYCYPVDIPNIQELAQQQKTGMILECTLDNLKRSEEFIVRAIENPTINTNLFIASNNPKRIKEYLSKKTRN